MDDGYQYFKKSWNILIVPHVKFWWMHEKWCQHDIMVVVIGELHSSWKGVVVTKLQLSCTIYMMSCNSCNLSYSTHNIQILWVANVRCNSKIKLQGQVQNTLFSHIDLEFFVSIQCLKSFYVKSSIVHIKVCKPSFFSLCEFGFIRSLLFKLETFFSFL
jgi:hypothetical protein